jgi:predicted secreted acid phosphatase
VYPKIFNEPTGGSGSLTTKEIVVKNDKKKAALIDIDGTLVTLTDFDYDVFKTNDQQVIDDYLKFWDKETLNAKALTGGVAVLMTLKALGYELVFVTARGQGCRKYTEKKLREIGVWDMVDSMWHRPKRYEGVKSYIYKEAMIKSLSKKYNFVIAMDDENANLEMMRGFGMKTIDAKTWW